MRLFSAVLSAVLLSACGTEEPEQLEPKAGDPCSGSLCDSAESGLWCELGLMGVRTLRSVDCKGRLGCITDTERNQVYCDITGNQPGDTCPQALDGGHFCDRFDDVRVLVCDSGNVTVAFRCDGSARCVETQDTVRCE